ncbi:hypothetical protein [Sodalis sp. RH16]|jgi:hypothetical protein|uniref:hypothetical protein n=1 Tax=unclassified Sodalis (in: enterobacteria) TaxID=2636512 RepID=UPI0039B38884
MPSDKWKKFAPETVQLIFTAVEEDDIVNEQTSLPQSIDLQCSQENIRNYYALCLQFWQEGFTRLELQGLVHKVLKGGELSATERMQYKYIRSRYKHLRFAQRLYSKKHESSLFFRQTTVVLGHFQDAFRNGNKDAIRFYGNILRIYLSLPVWIRVHYALRHTRLDSENGFIVYRQEQMRALRALIAKPQLTGREFHSVRKFISQQVSYYDTLRSIDPSNQDAYKISRFLANINGLMGDRHDEMVADKLAGRKAYDEPALLDINIRQRLELFLARYPM